MSDSIKTEKDEVRLELLHGAVPKTEPLSTESHADEKDGDVTETTQELKPEDDPFYKRYSNKRKAIIVFIVSLSCFLAPSASFAFLPAVSVIAKRFNTTGTIINVTNALYCIVMAISPCLMSPFGDAFGRKLTFLVCSTGFTVCSLIVGFSQDLAMFTIFRCLSGLFGTAFFSVGGSIVSDIYIPQQRGRAMGWVLSGSQIGPAISPVMGGILITYVNEEWGWRSIFFLLTGLGLVGLGLSLLVLPETSRAHSGAEKVKFNISNYNPFSVVVAFRYLNLVFAALVSVSLHYNMYTLLTPIRYVVDPRFNLTKPIDGALFYLAPGLGYITGSFIGGRWADRYVKKYIRKRDGVRIPEDRLRSTYVAHGFVMPVTSLIYGWSLKSEKGGMALPIVAMFFQGCAQTVCFPSINAYCVDSMPELGGDAIASNYMVRYLAAAVATATCLTQLQTIGVGWTSTIAAIILWLGFGSVLILIHYGERMRHKN